VNDVTTSWAHDIGSNTELTYKASILDDIGLHDPEIVRITDIDFYMQILSEYKMIGEQIPVPPSFLSK